MPVGFEPTETRYNLPLVSDIIPISITKHCHSQSRPPSASGFLIPVSKHILQQLSLNPFCIRRYWDGSDTQGNRISLRRRIRVLFNKDKVIAFA